MPRSLSLLLLAKSNQGDNKIKTSKHLWSFHNTILLSVGWGRGMGIPLPTYTTLYTTLHYTRSTKTAIKEQNFDYSLWKRLIEKDLSQRSDWLSNNCIPIVCICYATTAVVQYKRTKRLVYIIWIEIRYLCMHACMHERVISFCVCVCWMDGLSDHPSNQHNK